MGKTIWNSKVSPSKTLAIYTCFHHGVMGTKRSKKWVVLKVSLQAEKYKVG
jgi:hypothetical protein